jgi:undecaprenyl-diphosphatase
MNTFDTSILVFLNQFAQRSHAFDYLMGIVCDSHLLKGGVLTSLLWWEWFREDEKSLERQRILLSSFVGCFFALFLARTLAHMLPFRERPIHNASLHFTMPYALSPLELLGWSSFPSDHATLFFALATGIMLESRTLGFAAITYVVVAIAFPRIYLGVHYPTDILAGAILGGGVTYVANLDSLQNYIGGGGLVWKQKHPASFYAVFFALSYQVATLFDDVRSIGSHLLGLFGGV